MYLTFGMHIQNHKYVSMTKFNFNYESFEFFSSFNPVQLNDAEFMKKKETNENRLENIDEINFSAVRKKLSNLIQI